MATSELIEISEVAAERTEALVGADVDLPRRGEQLPTYALDVRGWAIGGEHEVTAAELVADGAVLARAPLAIERPHVGARHGVDPRIGYRALVNGLLLPPEFDLGVRALTASGTRLPIAVVRGRRAELAGREDGDLQPLIVTTLGRTGSMLFMRLLEAHPDLLVIHPHRYEQRVTGYWAEVLLTLTDPNSYLLQLAPHGSLDRPRWWLGDDGPTPGFDPQRGISRSLGSDGVAAVAEFCRARVDAVYAEAAAEQPGARARYFAEKHTLRSAAVTAELYPLAAEVLLVRDFRDMVASILAFNRKRGVLGFGEGGAHDPLDYVDRLGGWAEGLVRRKGRRGARAYVVRYEDLVRQPRATLAGLLEHLRVDATDGAVERMIAAAGTEMPELAEHATSSDAEASIGRWRKDLGDELERASERAFGTALEAFGYERGA